MKNLYYRITNFLLQNPILSIGIGRIMTLGAIFIYIALCGCSTSPRYTEGTNLSLGAYLPVDGQLMGVEVINYLNGCSVRTGSNQSFQVSRTHCSTNSWGWGLLTTVEGSDTSIQVGSSTNNVQVNNVQVK